MLEERLNYILRMSGNIISFCHVKSQAKSAVLCVSHVRLFVTPWTVARQAPLFVGILQAGIMKWVAMSFSRGSSQPRDRTWVSLRILCCLVAYPVSRGSSWPKNWTGVSCIAGGLFTSWAIREAPRKEYSTKKYRNYGITELCQTFN